MFPPSATQCGVLKSISSLLVSVLDGYNASIFGKISLMGRSFKNDFARVVMQLTDKLEEAR